MTMPTLNAIEQWVFVSTEKCEYRYDFSYRMHDIMREYRYNDKLDAWVPMPSYHCTIGEHLIIEPTKAKMKDAINELLESIE